MMAFEPPVSPTSTEKVKTTAQLPLVEPTSVIRGVPNQSNPDVSTTATNNNGANGASTWRSHRRTLSTASNSSFEDVVLESPISTVAPDLLGQASPSGSRNRLDVIDVSPYRPGNANKVRLKGKMSALGLTLRDLPAGHSLLLPGPFISHITPGSLAARCGGLMVGDQICSINGVSVVCLNVKQILQKLKTSVAKGVELGVVRQPTVYDFQISRATLDHPFGLELVGNKIVGIDCESPAENAGVHVDHCVLMANNVAVIDDDAHKLADLIRTSTTLELRTMPSHVYETIAV